MKYSIYVKNYFKREILRDNHKINKAEAEKKAEEMFNEMLSDAFYESALSKLSDDDNLKKLELEEKEFFLDYHRGADKVINNMIPDCYLFHGLRLDNNHAKLISILDTGEIRCGKDTSDYYYCSDENCNEGEYISLTEYTGFDDSLEFDTFVGENVAFIIKPKINPEKCKYLPYEEWVNIRKKLPKTKNRYSYARHEYQYKGPILLTDVVGICYPLFRLKCGNWSGAEADFERVKKILRENGLGCLPIYDQSNFFTKLGTAIDYDKLPKIGRFMI